jgi:hypothetical protein
MTFFIKQNDTSPAIEHQLQDDEGNPVDLTAFREISFHMRKQGVDQPKVDEDTSDGVEVVDLESGKVRYNWSEDDTDESGAHEAEWEVTFADDTTETFPNRRNITVQIQEEIA